MNHLNPTPKGWLNFPPMASRLILDKFFAFKTPLDKVFTGNLKENEFTVSSVFEYLDGKQLKMGLWIDLSIPERFQKSEVESRGCQYVKLPNIEKILTLVQNFIKNNPSEIIGIHCTHGINRTGFVMVCIMVEVYNWEWRKGVEEFKEARPPGIYRKFVIDELMKRYEKPSASIAVPPQKTTKGKLTWPQIYFLQMCHAKDEGQVSDKRK